MRAPFFVWGWDPLEGGDQMLYVPPDTGSVVTQHLGSGRIVVGDKSTENNSAPSLVHVVDPALLRVIPLLFCNTFRADSK